MQLCSEKLKRLGGLGEHDPRLDRGRCDAADEVVPLVEAEFPAAEIALAA
jgi:hypothetical protein